MFIFQVLVLVVQSLLFIQVGYLLVLVIAAWRAPRDRIFLPATKPVRFAVLIPAHNEEHILPATLTSLMDVDYPADRLDVYVIADNCTDDTAGIARSYDVQVLERSDTTWIGKGYALNWGFGNIRQAGKSYDAYVIVDADTVVSSTFFKIIADHLASGQQVIQAYYSVKNPTMSWNTSLRYAALVVLHYLRPLGRSSMGFSAGLKGNGMVFTQDVLEQHPWSGSITEDIENHMALLLDGIRVHFAPKAIVLGEMPETFVQSRSQLDRWERGRIQMARKYLPRLWKAALRQPRHTFLYLDAMIEHLIPPFSLLFGLSFAVLVVAVTLFIAEVSSSLVLRGLSDINLLLSLFLVLGQVLYLLVGLGMVAAPSRVYLGLFYTPWFILLKLVQYIKMLYKHDSLAWVKTPRNELKRYIDS
jgi:1,2-diacylglycerol 3-beta-glucosyltransferase